MRAKRKPASDETKQHYSELGDHLAEHFDNIMDYIYKYNEQKIMDEMNLLTVCYWSTHFINGSVREGPTLEKDVDNFVNDLRRVLLENIREANHIVEGNIERLN